MRQNIGTSSFSNSPEWEVSPEELVLNNGEPDYTDLAPNDEALTRKALKAKSDEWLAGLEKARRDKQIQYEASVFAAKLALQTYK